MSNPLPIPEELWAKVPPDAQAAIAAVFLAIQQRTHDLETRLNDLEARLKLNSTNSHKPPSSDLLGVKRKPPAPATGKKRGGQPRHRRAKRTLVPPEKIRQTIACKPTNCRRCGHGLLGDDPSPLLHQIAELPRVEPVVDEYQLHRLNCPDCKLTTLGSEPEQVVSSDRFSSYAWIAARWRQICWAHLRRDFQAMIDRCGDGKPIGEGLLKQSHRLFHDWHRVRDGTLDREAFGKRMVRLRGEVRRSLEEGSKCSCARTSSTCWEILKVEERLWTFARVDGIEPTNNAAERALRFAVIWRRIRGGTDSERESRFVERTLSVVATCHQQGRNVLDYLTSCFEADHRGEPIPSLLPSVDRKVKTA